MLAMFNQLIKKCLITKEQFIGHFFIFLLVISITSFAPNSLAESSLAPQSEQGQSISPGEAAKIAKKRYGGKVLKIKRDGNKYRIKLLLPSGKVKNVYIDAVR